MVAGARFGNLAGVAVMIIAIVAARYALVPRLNAIPNTPQACTAWGGTLLGIYAALFVVGAAAALAGACSNGRTVRWTGRAAIVVLGLSLAAHLVPGLGGLAAVALHYVAAGLLALAALSTLRSQAPGRTRAAAFAGPVTAIGFAAAVTAGLVLDKLLALAWAQAID